MQLPCVWGMESQLRGGGVTVLELEPDSCPATALLAVVHMGKLRPRKRKRLAAGFQSLRSLHTCSSLSFPIWVGLAPCCNRQQPF